MNYSQDHGSQDHGFMELMSRCTVIKQQISSKYETPRGRVLGFQDVC